MDHLKKLIESAKKDFEECTTLTELDNAKSKYIGKTGPLTEAMRGLSKLPKEEKPKESKMKNYMVTHTLKSDEAMDAYFQAMETMSEADIRGAMKNDKASFQMQWNAGKADKVMFCWWKAESPEAIVETLGDMAQLFDNDIREMPNVYDFKD